MPCLRAEALVEIAADDVHQLLGLVLEEVVGAFDRLVLDLMPFWVFSFSITLITSLIGATRSCEPCTNSPEDGQGARNEKSKRLAGAATEMKPSISGRRIRSCMPIQAPNEMPAIQQARASGLTAWAQSSAAAASESSPWPWSNVPWLRPTPRKLKRSAEKPRSTKP